MARRCGVTWRQLGRRAAEAVSGAAAVAVVGEGRESVLRQQGTNSLAAKRRRSSGTAGHPDRHCGKVSYKTIQTGTSAR